jgi:hypothetical protein
MSRQYGHSHRQPRRWCAFAALAMVVVSVSAQTPGPTLPSAIDLVYRTTGDTRLAGLPLTLHARTTMRWRLDGQHYEAHLHMDTIGFDQDSTGHLSADGALVPDRYDEKRPFHSPDSVVLDWARGQVRFGTAAPAPAPEPGAQDRLSLQFELARLRRSFPQQLAAGSTYQTWLIGTHDVDAWKFTISEESAVQTGRGPMHATRVAARRLVGTVEETMDVWLGAEVYWMPIRIRIVDRNHSVIDSVLESVQTP